MILVTPALIPVGCTKKIARWTTLYLKTGRSLDRKRCGVKVDVNKIICGNCPDVLKTFHDNCIDSIVTDPPYGLSFMGKHWDYDVPKVEVWRECLRVLKPGGHLLSFSGTRTYHRMAVNIEDAGFEIRDMIAWIYGS